MHKVTLIPGDGIGPEITQVVVEVFDKLKAPISWEMVDAGAKAIKKYGTPLPEVVLESIKRNKVALKGPITTPVGEGFRSVNVTLREKLNLYANLRPVKSLPGINNKFEKIDLVIIRENTECLYKGIEYSIDESTSCAVRVITRAASEKIAKYAFDYARRHDRKKVTAVHKANIQKLTDGLFLQSIRNISNNYPEVEYEEKIVDNMSMQLVLNPEKYDVIVCPNLYGDILSDLAAGLIGGLGLAPGANIGDEIAVFEAVHGSAPDIAGKGIANPIALLRSSVMLLEYLEEYQLAKKLEFAIEKAVEDKNILTPDLKGKGTTESLKNKIISMLDL
ncbi:MAG TPA: isocitrate/isopropylmalate dehydrogenase family protein [Defluviitoga tunisiensis]|jgi:isocitrate dehydrogenase (NAD+)|nr:isocitrate/isopropylmalate dehydrogenase family protein [Defluviitoga tunisiensis]MDY0379372.1 isocitrate/isopropylmalate dehydrogenase family protein [Defluviitoga tunisiensis]HOB54642.1 isocitrate/isopropylmalate dehydrogenase family protein [Defluviitoga tunisiensis]HOK15583.1 isocitrate/isopropylmalate dehydrogenase family protein [Defluviitoga tunisiensis]HOL85801.1 isocitrate/isopropylmalate dehydrogenase family protein [Defluviitoga tunisiensis]